MGALRAGLSWEKDQYLSKNRKKIELFHYQIQIPWASFFQITKFHED
jgi:hypothetical protein